MNTSNPANSFTELSVSLVLISILLTSLFSTLSARWLSLRPPLASVLPSYLGASSCDALYRQWALSSELVGRPLEFAASRIALAALVAKAFDPPKKSPGDDIMREGEGRGTFEARDKVFGLQKKMERRVEAGEERRGRGGFEGIMGDGMRIEERLGERRDGGFLEKSDGTRTKNSEESRQGRRVDSETRTRVDVAETGKSENAFFETRVETDNGFRIFETPRAKRWLWFGWFPLIGSVWALEECLLVYPDATTSLLVAAASLMFKYKTIGSKTLLGFVIVLAAAVFMTRSAHVLPLSIFAGSLRALRFIISDYVVHRYGAMSPLTLIWAPGMTASFITCGAFLIFEYNTPSPVNRGILDFLGMACLGTFFLMGAVFAAYEVMSASSVLSLQASTCIIEATYLTVLAPLAGLIGAIPVILPLNISGLVLAWLSYFAVLKTDTFASLSSVHVESLLKFIEADKVLREPVAHEIEEGESLLDNEDNV